MEDMQTYAKTMRNIMKTCEHMQGGDMRAFGAGGHLRWRPKEYPPWACKWVCTCVSEPPSPYPPACKLGAGGGGYLGIWRVGDSGDSESISIILIFRVYSIRSNAAVRVGDGQFQK